MRVEELWCEAPRSTGELLRTYSGVVIFFLLIFCLSMPCSASAEPSAEADALTYTVIDGIEVCVTGAAEDLPVLSIPAYLAGLPVTQIGNGAFEENETLTEVALPDTVVRIGNDAFRRCGALKRVHLSEGLAEIGDDAFAHCTALEDVRLPKTLRTVGQGAFWHCTAIDSVALPDGIEEIRDETFGYCERLAHVEFPEELCVIGSEAFCGTALREVTVPSGVAEIGQAAFSDCPVLREIRLPQGIREVPPLFAADCTSLADAELPDTVQRIGSEAFSHCASLEKIVIPDSVEEIGSLAFWACWNLNPVRVPSGVRTIAFGTFWECRNLAQISLPAGLTRIEGMAFYETDLTDVYFAGTERQWQAIQIDEEGYLATGQEVENSNGAFQYASIHCDSSGPVLPEGVQLRAYSQLQIETGTPLGTELQGISLARHPRGLPTEDLLGQFIIADGVLAVVLDAEGSEMQLDAAVGTGDTLRFSASGSDEFSAVIIVSGDVLGTGSMSLSQMVRMASAFRGSDPLYGPYLAAGDYEHTGSIDLSDLVREARLFRESSMRRA